MIQFDLRIFFRWVGENPPPRDVWKRLGDFHRTNLPTFMNWCFFFGKRKRFHRFFHVEKLALVGEDDCLIIYTYIFHQGIVAIEQVKRKPVHCRDCRRSSQSWKKRKGDRPTPVMFMVLNLGH